MRLLALLLLLGLPSVAQAQAQGPDRKFPDKWLPLLKRLTKTQVEDMQASANEFCKGLDYTAVKDLYNDVGQCTLMQASAILSVDVDLSDLAYDPPTKYRPNQIKKCWALYHALGSKDAENLAHCFADIKGFELLQRVANVAEKPSAPISSTYCQRVSDTAGGSYAILEEYMKQENAARRRLGQ